MITFWIYRVMKPFRVREPVLNAFLVLVGICCDVGLVLITLELFLENL